MKETLFEILNSIDHHIQKETECNAANRTIGRGRAVTDKNDMQVWVTNREYKSNYQFVTNEYGCAVSVGDDKRVLNILLLVRIRIF